MFDYVSDNPYEWMVNNDVLVCYVFTSVYTKVHTHWMCFSRIYNPFRVEAAVCVPFFFKGGNGVLMIKPHVINLSKHSSITPYFFKPKHTPYVIIHLFSRTGSHS